MYQTHEGRHVGVHPMEGGMGEEGYPMGGGGRGEGGYPMEGGYLQCSKHPAVKLSA